MNALGEKSMLIFAALTLGMIITWLIATDSNGAAPQEAVPVGAGIAAMSIADKT